MAGLLDGKVALITGASTGIGRATAQVFAREGAKVAVADVNVEGAEETVRLIKDAGGAAIFIQTDVSQAAETQAMVEKVVETYGRLDCAFNNAGIEGDFVPTPDYPDATWDRVIGINLKGVWLSMKAGNPADAQPRWRRDCQHCLSGRFTRHSRRVRLRRSQTWGGRTHQDRSA